MKQKTKEAVNLAFSGLSPAQERNFTEVLAGVSKLRLVIPDGNPDPSWTVFIGVTLEEGRSKARDFAKENAFCVPALEQAGTAEMSHALNSRHDATWNQERHLQRRMAFKVVEEHLAEKSVYSEHIIDDVARVVAVAARFAIINTPDEIGSASRTAKELDSVAKRNIWASRTLEVESALKAITKGYVPLYSQNGKLIVYSTVPRTERKAGQSIEVMIRPS